MNNISAVFEYFTNEKPIIFFDTNPGPGPTFVWKTFDRFTRHLTTAWTGVAYHDVEPGQLRLFWVTTDGTEGKRDYEIREYQDVRMGFEQLCKLPEVARAAVLGYASQNPYSMYGESEYEKQERERKAELAKHTHRDFVPRKHQQVNVSATIDMILEREKDNEVKLVEESKGTEEV